jgi:ligand-binding SRPBCC domain-containing protein
MLSRQRGVWAPAGWDSLELRNSEEARPVMQHTLRTSHWVPFPVELVFAFLANPGNLPHLMPKWQQAKIESSRFIAPPARPVALDPALRFQSPAAGAGSEMVISFRPVTGIGFRVGWLARITEFEWNSHFCDEQLKGPFASWKHCHRVASETRDGVAGTFISDEVDYSLPLGPLGSLGNAIFVRKQLEKTFAYRQQELERILPIAARQAARRS